MVTSYMGEKSRKSVEEVKNFQSQGMEMKTIINRKGNILYLPRVKYFYSFDANISIVWFLLNKTDTKKIMVKNTLMHEIEFIKIYSQIVS